MSVFKPQSWLRLLSLGSMTMTFGLGVADGADAAVVYLVRMDCIRPQEIDGDGDTLLLGINADGRGYANLKQGYMRPGQSWNVNYAVPFLSGVEFKLKEDDKWSDDYLGGVIIRPIPGAGVATFSAGGAYYELHYYVTP